MPKVAITGSGGLVGRALTKALVADGVQVVRLVRHPPRRTNDQGGDESVIESQWSASDGLVDRKSLEGATAVVNLAGESIGSGRWTKPRRARIYQSRVDGTRNLVASLAKLERPPQVLLNASAVGFYGDRPDEVVNESSDRGRGFLSDVCVDWEREALRLEAADVRVVTLRFGVILSRHGGALNRMLTPFRLGLGGKLGAGDQFMSWISLQDTVAAIRHCLGRSALRGPVNLCAPDAVTNARYTRELGAALKRPTVFTVPATLLRLGLGQMADELLLASTNARPAVLEESGFRFRHPTIRQALTDIL